MPTTKMPSSGSILKSSMVNGASPPFVITKRPLWRTPTGLSPRDNGLLTSRLGPWKLVTRSSGQPKRPKRQMRKIGVRKLVNCIAHSLPKKAYSLSLHRTKGIGLFYAPRQRKKIVCCGAGEFSVTIGIYAEIEGVTQTLARRPRKRESFFWG